MGKLSAFDRARKGADNGILPNKVGKRLRTPSSIQGHPPDFGVSVWLRLPSGSSILSET